MKILHISTSINGGAALSAYRLHKALMTVGVDSSFMSKDCLNDDFNKTFLFNRIININKFQTPELTLKNYILEKTFKKFSKEKNKLNKDYNKKISLINPYVSGDFEIFSSPFTLYDLLESPLYKSSDIIHLHWISGYLDYESFFKQNKKPIVWTLHDLNPILGGYHYELDLNRNSNNTSIDKMFYLHKSKILSSVLNLTVIAPSNWLKNKVELSKVFSKDTKILQCFYHIDKNIYRILDKNSCRNILNIPNDKIVFMFVAENVNNYRKGYDILERIINDKEFENVFFLVVGECKTNYENQWNNVKYTGSIKSEIAMSIAYNCADYFVLPSREDNLPNTMLESLFCGVPVISFNISDSKFILEVEQLGIVCNEISVSALKNTILNQIKSGILFDNRLINEKANILFNKKYVIDFYYNLYVELLKKNN
jgi:glycosyltransferase involved in cell wall biosynthesis